MIDWTQLKAKFDDDGNVISGEVVFSHVDDGDGVLRHYAIDRIVNYIEHAPVRPEIIEFQIDAVWAAFALTHRGVERHRLERITPADLAHYPIIMAHHPDGKGRPDHQGQHMVIDGHHRYCKAAMLGWRTLRAYVLPPELWEQYLIYIPEEVLSAQSKKDALLNQHNVPIDSHIK